MANRAIPQVTRRRAVLTLLGAVTICPLTACHGPAASPTTTYVTMTATQTQIPTSSSMPMATTASAPSTPRGGDPLRGVDTTNVDAVADAVLAAVNTYDTRIDTSPLAASRRAAAFLGGAYATSLVAATHEGAPGAQWTTLAQHDGYTTASVQRREQDGAAPDTSIAASRVRSVTITAHGADGWTTTWPAVVEYVTLQRATARSPWQVTAILAP